MKLKISLCLMILILLVLALLPNLALAAETDGGGGDSQFGMNLSDLGTIITRLIAFLLGLVGAIAIIMIVVGGIRYILAGGDMKATQSAKGTITFAVIGLVIVLLAVVLVSFVGSLFGVSGLNIIRFGI